MKVNLFDYVITEYKFELPLFFKGYTVRYEHHNGLIREGRIVGVVTHYSHINNAYHIYTILPLDTKYIQPKGRLRRKYHIGETKIIEIISIDSIK